MPGLKPQRQLVEMRAPDGRLVPFFVEVQGEEVWVEYLDSPDSPRGHRQRFSASEASLLGSALLRASGAADLFIR